MHVMLKKFKELKKSPRELLKSNFTIKEMSDSHRCCGFGGVTMQTQNYHFAKAAGEPKAAMIKESGADIVSAECT